MLEIVVELVTQTNALYFGILAGEGGQNWDLPPNSMSRLKLRYDLYADPNGDGSGLGGPILATWTSGGSLRVNMGEPMANNVWSAFNFPKTRRLYTLWFTDLDHDGSHT